jgi:hypothetical protein
MPRLAERRRRGNDTVGCSAIRRALACVVLAGCTSTDAVLQPSALTTTEPSAVQTASLGSDFRLGFDPVVGASGEATQPLSARLSSLAGESGIPLAGPGDAATLSMKGYFSAISEEGVTTVIYVWDVVDRHRNAAASHPGPAAGGGRRGRRLERGRRRHHGSDRRRDDEPACDVACQSTGLDSAPAATLSSG